MACSEIFYTTQKFDIYMTFLSHGHMACSDIPYTILIVDIDMRFPQSKAHSWRAISFSISYAHD